MGHETRKVGIGPERRDEVQSCDDIRFIEHDRLGSTWLKPPLMAVPTAASRTNFGRPRLVESLADGTATTSRSRAEKILSEGGVRD
jgi:hypothetical protein